MSSRRIGGFSPFDSFRCEFKSPRDDECDWKANRNDRDDQPHNPIWNLEEWKNLRRDLDHKPADNRVRHGNLVNIAPLQLGEERRFLVHHSPGPGNWTPSFWHNATNRGSSRYS